MQRLLIDRICQEIGISNKYLITRQIGERIYEPLIQQIKPNDQPTVLVFPSDQFMDVSFADETIIRLGQDYEIGKYGNGTLILHNLSTDSLHNIEAAINLQKLKLAFISTQNDGSWSLVGQLEQSLRDTLLLVEQNKLITAPALSKILNLAINSASNRLKRLYDQRLLRREFEITENGLQYTYYFWIDDNYFAVSKVNDEIISNE